MKASIIFITMTMVLSACSMKQGKTEQVSTIDCTLQNKVALILENKLEEFGAQSGQIIVKEVKTGQIKALVGKAHNIPYRSQLLHSATLLAALETGKVHLDDTIDTGNGVCVVGNDTLFDHNWSTGGYGKITVRQALAYNSVVGNYKMMTKAFGDNIEECFSKVREIYSLTGDTTSLIAIASHGEWATVYPMLTLAFINEIATNIDNDSLRSALRYTVTDGFGIKANTDKTEVAGVSGTTLQGDGSYCAEFCGYFPYDNPQYSIIVAIHKRDIPVSGGAMAGNVFKEIAEYLAYE